MSEIKTELQRVNEKYSDRTIPYLADHVFLKFSREEVSELRDRIKQLEQELAAALASQAQQSQWISVEERLPETYIADDRELIVLGKPIGASIKSDDVLVLLKTGRVKMDRLAGIAGNEPFWWTYRNLVVSWMPLPPAPEGGEKPSCRQCGAPSGNSHCLGDIFNCSDLAAPEGE